MLRHGATRRDTGRAASPEAGPMRKKTTGRKKAASTSRGTKSLKPATGAKKPSRPTSRTKAKTATKPATAPKVKAAAKPKKKPTAARKAKAAAHSPKRAASRKPGRPALSMNPSTAEGLAKVWKAWTGANPTKVIELGVTDAKRFGLPAKAVLLGRVSWFATKDGREEGFGEDGPLMITDATAKRIWLVSEKARRFDIDAALIGYLARKPKFGDRSAVEYVHAFEGKAHAAMSGQVGALTGSFRITPAGLEG